MPYHCIVCVKQVPDTANVTAEAMKADGTVNRAALPAVFNPDDLHALEMALAVRDQHGGTVTVLSMGPPKAADVLRECLYRGADRVILITDRRAAASDTLATSYILAQAIRKLARYDLVFCGRQAIDGDTAQVGPQCAEKLGIPQVTGLERIVALADGVGQFRRNTGHGWEIVEARLPVLATVLQAANQPRPRAARRTIRFKDARTPAELLAARGLSQFSSDVSGGDAENGTVPFPTAPLSQMAEAMAELGLLIEQWSLDDIAADLNRCGLAGSPTKVHRVQAIVLTKEGYSEVAPTDEGVTQLVHELVVDRTLG